QQGNQFAPWKLVALARNGLPGKRQLLAIPPHSHRIGRAGRHAEFVADRARMRRQVFTVDGDNSVAGAQLFSRALRVNTINVKLAIRAVTMPSPIAAGRITPDVEARRAIDQQQCEEGDSENESKLFARHILSIYILKPAHKSGSVRVSVASSALSAKGLLKRNRLPAESAPEATRTQVRLSILYPTPRG